MTRQVSVLILLFKSEISWITETTELERYFPRKLLFFIYFFIQVLYILRMFDCLGFCHCHATAMGNSITQELTHRTKCRNWNLKCMTLVFIAVSQSCQLIVTDVSLTLKMSLKKVGFGWNCLVAVNVAVPAPVLPP